MKKIEKEELNQLFQSVIKKFKSRCWICKGEYNTDEAFVFHHLEYLPTDKMYSDFKLPNGEPDRLSYHRYLIPIIKKNPKRFMMLHWKHHWLAESWARLKPENFERMVKVARQINKRKYRRNSF